jgi:hypothetical protein
VISVVFVLVEGSRMVLGGGFSWILAVAYLIALGSFGYLAVKSP